MAVGRHLSLAFVACVAFLTSGVIRTLVAEQQCRPASTGQANTPDQVAFVHGQMGPQFLTSLAVGDGGIEHSLQLHCEPSTSEPGKGVCFLKPSNGKAFPEIAPTLPAKCSASKSSPVKKTSTKKLTSTSTKSKVKKTGKSKSKTCGGKSKKIQVTAKHLYMTSLQLQNSDIAKYEWARSKTQGSLMVPVQVPNKITPEVCAAPPPMARHALMLFNPHQKSVNVTVALGKRPSACALPRLSLQECGAKIMLPSNSTVELHLRHVPNYSMPIEEIDIYVVDAAGVRSAYKVSAVLPYEVINSCSSHETAKTAKSSIPEAAWLKFSWLSILALITLSIAIVISVLAWKVKWLWVRWAPALRVFVRPSKKKSRYKLPKVAATPRTDPLPKTSSSSSAAPSNVPTSAKNIAKVAPTVTKRKSPQAVHTKPVSTQPSAKKPVPTKSASSDCNGSKVMAQSAMSMDSDGPTSSPRKSSSKSYMAAHSLTKSGREERKLESKKKVGTGSKVQTAVVAPVRVIAKQPNRSNSNEPAVTPVDSSAGNDLLQCSSVESKVSPVVFSSSSVNTCFTPVAADCIQDLSMFEMSGLRREPSPHTVSSCDSKHGITDLSSSDFLASEGGSFDSGYYGDIGSAAGDPVGAVHTRHRSDIGTMTPVDVSDDEALANDFQLHCDLDNASCASLDVQTHKPSVTPAAEILESFNESVLRLKETETAYRHVTESPLHHSSDFEEILPSEEDVSARVATSQLCAFATPFDFDVDTSIVLAGSSVPEHAPAVTLYQDAAESPTSTEIFEEPDLSLKNSPPTSEPEAFTTRLPSLAKARPLETSVTQIAQARSTRRLPFAAVPWTSKLSECAKDPFCDSLDSLQPRPIHSRTQSPLPHGWTYPMSDSFGFQHPQMNVEYVPCLPLPAPLAMAPPMPASQWVAAQSYKAVPRVQPVLDTSTGKTLYQVVPHPIYPDVVPPVPLLAAKPLPPPDLYKCRPSKTSAYAYACKPQKPVERVQEKLEKVFRTSSRDSSRTIAASSWLEPAGFSSQTTSVRNNYHNQLHNDTFYRPPPQDLHAELGSYDSMLPQNDGFESAHDEDDDDDLLRMCFNSITNDN